MPTIANLPGGIRIVMRYNEHPPPHFHAVQGGRLMRVVIATMQVMPFSTASATMARTVLAWAANHQTELSVCWVRAESGEPPGTIS
jgi:hypothetical protein